MTYSVALALQGGGAHGAFTWGVLDRLLEDDELAVSALSGASAGAMNAALLAYGLLDGPEAARSVLRSFWEGIALNQPAWPIPSISSSTTESSPGLSTALQGMLYLTRFFSPEQLNPFDHNPLRDVLRSCVDFERLRQSPLKLFIATTQVNTGRLRLFTTDELTEDVLLASACLPTMHHTIVIDDEPYWDGGLTANPPLFPLAYQTNATDLIIVSLTPHRWPNTPESVQDIQHRMNEISFGSSLYTELQGLAMAKREADKGLFAIGRVERRLRALNLHLIDAQPYTAQLDTLSKLNTQREFIQSLFDAGRERAEGWLQQHGDAVGEKTSMRLSRMMF